MPDIVSTAVREVMVGSDAAIALVFAAGVLSSFGPCTITRLLAVSGLSIESPRKGRTRAAVAFTAGLVTMYIGFGAVAGLLTGILRFTHAVYFALAAGCLIAGARTLLREVNEQQCCEDPPGLANGGAFVTGAGFAFVVSPCCAPVLAALLLYGAQSGNTPGSCLLLAAFGLGHAVPVIAASLLTQRLRDAAASLRVSEALRVVMGGLLLSMAGYYGCLA